MKITELIFNATKYTFELIKLKIGPNKFPIFYSITIYHFQTNHIQLYAQSFNLN